MSELLHSEPMPDEQPRRLGEAEFEVGRDPFAPDPRAAQAFARLHEIVARLRAPDGCPWDREQTHASLRPHLIEEAAEVLDAIERDDVAALREELGDLMLQPVLHTQLAREAGHFDISDVLSEISDKLVRRHPHVFGETSVNDSGDVLRNWDAIKKQEKAARGETPTSVLGDAVEPLPALSLALKVSKRAAKVGFEWPDVAAVMDKLREETQELEADLSNRERASEELGDLLFTIVNVARWLKIDPELALRDQVRRFRGRFESMEAQARERGLELDKLSPDEWETMWEKAKEQS